ncbi:MAG: transketolase C-terminal domain-containing protein [Acidimicrobiales bacterium]|nr:transketolase C-terminal domain-containing protein [Acidimicrobiales bacterium]
MSKPDARDLDEDVLHQIEQRILWLGTRMVDEANRREPMGIKVGGHQASSASMVSILAALWFGHLRADDKVAVKPHASPAYHALMYLIGALDRSYLTKLRARGGLQAYPSRTKDPDVPDYSTGSVGLGAVAPLFSAAARRYCDDHFGDGPPARFFALAGDAELDEGNVWEAIAEPVTAGLGNFTLIIDLNRQSLDRIIPDIQETRLAGFFHNAGWHVAEAKYGRRLTAAFERPGGDALRNHIDAMSNEAYQELFKLDGDRLRDTFLRGADPAVGRALTDVDDQDLLGLLADLGGHDLSTLGDALDTCDSESDRPSVVFAYTIKGWGLPTAGDPLNHAALLTEDQIDDLRCSVELDRESEWNRFDPDSAAGRLCSETGARLRRDPFGSQPRPAVPARASQVVRRGTVSTQEAFGRTLTRLAAEEVGSRLVTATPDVSVSTNLGGWINKVGVYSHDERADHGGSEQLLKWAPAPSGQHIELGISEMNLFMLLGQLGLSHEHHGQHLLPVATVYDPFVLRGLDALIYGLYNAARFVVAGTPAGVTLAPEGGAHQSSVTASLGMELPGLAYVEPCFATEVDWMLCEALDRLGGADGESSYLRLSTRPIDQAPFDAAIARTGEQGLRELVLDGGYRLAETPVDGRPAVTIVATGALVPEALCAAEELDGEGVGATVINVTSPDRLYRSWQGQVRPALDAGRAIRRPSHLHRLIPPAERDRPIVSVHDAASHTLAWLGSAIGAPQVSLGVDRFGESGTIHDLHELTGISTGDVVNAALLAIYDLA